MTSQNSKAAAALRRWSHCILAYLTNLSRLRAISRIVLILTGCLLLFLAFTSRANRTVLGPLLGADFSHFYAAGWIVRHGDESRLYDIDYQNEVYHQLFPALEETAALPFVHAPFFAVAMAPLTAFPYKVAYAVWVAIAVSSYWGALRLLSHGIPFFQRPQGKTALLMSLSFLPFIMEVALGGQASAFAVLSIALCIACERKGHPIVGGICLSIVFYKITLLLFVLPMLVLTRRWRILTGTLIGAVTLVAASAVRLGPRLYSKYVQTLLWFGEFRETKPEAFPLYKFVDVTSFMQLLTGWPFAWLQIVAAVGGLGVGAMLAWIWIRGAARADQPAQDAGCTWGLAMLWTPCLNLYCGIYDSILIVPGVLLFAKQLESSAQRCIHRFLFVAVIVYFGAWVSQLVAILTGAQIYTLLLLWLAVEGTRLCHPVSTRDGGDGVGKEMHCVSVDRRTDEELEVSPDNTAGR